MPACRGSVQPNRGPAFRKPPKKEPALNGGRAPGLLNPEIYTEG